MTGSHETAQDIVHDVFLKIWQQKEQLPAVQQLSAYLYRMAHNRAFNGFRSLAVRKLAQEQLIYGTAGSGNEIEDNYAAKEIRVLIKTLAKKLTPQQQQVFEMSRGEGLKNEEIAARLGISVFTVKKHLTNALHFLRKEISGSLGAQVIVIYMAGVIFL
ncbi:RNA polymerase sigma-70 factor [Niabella hirudinis]|uniref:RNA polymerase sigma-70 factor n=1 Tax=Niabella hirudinis TaxID=1285929 RepID=UPI003EB70338